MGFSDEGPTRHGAERDRKRPSLVIHPHLRKQRKRGRSWVSQWGIVRLRHVDQGQWPTVALGADWDTNKTAVAKAAMANTRDVEVWVDTRP